jgi:hypothetical protein
MMPTEAEITQWTEAIQGILAEHTDWTEEQANFGLVAVLNSPEVLDWMADEVDNWVEAIEAVMAEHPEWTEAQANENFINLLKASAAE